MPERIVDHDEWLAARKALLAEEKELTKQRDRLSAKRRGLPWVRVEKDYVFEGPEGHQSLADLFAGKSQLLVYHFMFAPGWGEGCKSCSYLADHFDGALPHLSQRDVSFVAVSRAHYAEIAPFKQRMGWRFKWVSSHGTEFNRDHQVSFTDEEIRSGHVLYNYAEGDFPVEEAPGMSVFLRGDIGEIFHTYSCYARGLDAFVGTYSLLDLVPKGRDEGEYAFTMQWVRHHDRYDDEKPAATSACCSNAAART
jgi:predicted dithiol-disulfide oxidoreductase (DUF899 family)